MFFSSPTSIMFQGQTKSSLPMPSKQERNNKPVESAGDSYTPREGLASKAPIQKAAYRPLLFGRSSNTSRPIEVINTKTGQISSINVRRSEDFHQSKYRPWAINNDADIIYVEKTAKPEDLSSPSELGLIPYPSGRILEKAFQLEVASFIHSNPSFTERGFKAVSEGVANYLSSVLDDAKTAKEAQSNLRNVVTSPRFTRYFPPKSLFTSENPTDAEVKEVAFKTLESGPRMAQIQLHMLAGYNLNERTDSKREAYRDKYHLFDKNEPKKIFAKSGRIALPNDAKPLATAQPGIFTEEEASHPFVQHLLNTMTKVVSRRRGVDGYKRDKQWNRTLKTLSNVHTPTSVYGSGPSWTAWECYVAAGEHALKKPSPNASENEVRLLKQQNAELMREYGWALSSEFFLNGMHARDETLMPLRRYGVFHSPLQPMATLPRQIKEAPDFKKIMLKYPEKLTPTQLIVKTKKTERV